MKCTKKVLCFLLVALMVVPAFGGVLASAAAEYSFTEDSSKAYEVADGVFYSEYTLSSGIYENVYVSASALEFNTEDYMVVAYGGAAGGAAYLANQYRLATEDGYEVVGAINGSFFSMDTSGNGNYGYLNEYLISGGEIYSADSGNAASEFGGAVAFMSDGTLANVTDSCLSFGLYINGQSISGGLGHVNKYGGRFKPANWGNGFYYFDTHSGDLYYDVTEDGEGNVYGEMISQALTFENIPGYQVLCRKVNGSRLSVDSTLRGEVVSVTDNSYRTKLAEDEFILFVKAGSPNVEYVKDLKAGDPIDITATELGGKASGVTSTADSVIGICGCLVRDGQNLTLNNSFNSGAAHSNTTKARWTAFGIKEDGSYVFFTTEGASTGSDGSVTLQDVAKAMIEMGCVDVYRLDGGGSSAMYVCDDGTGKAGFKQYSGRSIADCLLIVKRTSPALQKGKTELQNLTSQYESKTGKAYKTAVADAKAVLADKTAVTGDFYRAYCALQSVVTAEAVLTSAANDAKTAQSADYAATVWNSIRSLQAEAEALLKGDPTLEEMEKVGTALRSALSSKGTYYNNLALGKSYTSKTASNSSYVDKDGVEMTDGFYGAASSAYDPAWAGWNSDAVFTIDLGAVYDNITAFKVNALQLTSWGIGIPKPITIAVSEDGENFTDVGELVDPEGLTRKEEGSAFTLSLELETGVKARYVRITPKRNLSFFFWSEIEVIRCELPGEGIEDPVDPPVDPPVEPPVDVPAVPEDPTEDWIGTAEKGADGNYTADVPYGYVWILNYLDGKIVGEDITVCTTDEAYKACNPNWAITIFLEEQEDGTYVALQNAIVTPENANAITIGENQIALVVHSSASNDDNPAYHNWLGKVVAMSVKKGDVFEILGDMEAVKAVVPADDPVDPPSEDPDESSAPDDESSEEPDESSEEPEESSEASTPATSAPAESSAAPGEDEGSALPIILIVVVVVVVAAVVVIILIKRKK